MKHLLSCPIHTHTHTLGIFALPRSGPADQWPELGQIDCPFQFESLLQKKKHLLCAPQLQLVLPPPCALTAYRSSRLARRRRQSRAQSSNLEQCFPAVFLPPVIFAMEPSATHGTSRALQQDQQHKAAVGGLARLQHALFACLKSFRAHPELLTYVCCITSGLHSRINWQQHHHQLLQWYFQ